MATAMLETKGLCKSFGALEVARDISFRLDPGARRDLWQYLKQLAAEEGVTSLLTTHYMEEAAQCSRIAILNAGKLVALGSPDELRAQAYQMARVELAAEFGRAKHKTLHLAGLWETTANSKR